MPDRSAFKLSYASPYNPYIPTDPFYHGGIYAPPYYSAAGWTPMYGTPLYGDRSFGQPAQLRGLGTQINMHFLTSALKNIEPRIDDDLVDRLNYYYTPSVILIFAILVSAKQYVGHPIECWVPAQFTKAMEQYTENYCWVQNTYWIPFADLIPSRIGEREKRQLGYYQWVPFVLAIQALLFYVPAMLWRMLSTQSGINVYGILQMVNDEHNVEPENRIRTAHILARHIDDALHHQRDFCQKSKPVYLWAFLRIGKYYGAYVTIVYCLVKLAYLANVVGQFFLINRFLQTEGYPYYGLNVLKDLLAGNEWQNSGKFPRVTLCDFEIRAIGNIHRHSVQCCLVINLFTEKIFIFLWLWYMFLAGLGIISLLYWLTTASIPFLRMKFIQNQLELTDTPAKDYNESPKLRKFVCNFLRPDGVFILRMIGWHGGTVLLTEIIHILWSRYWGLTVVTDEIFRKHSHLIPPRMPAGPSIEIIDYDLEERQRKRSVFEASTPADTSSLAEVVIQAQKEPDNISLRSFQRLKEKFKFPKKFKFLKSTKDEAQTQGSNDEPPNA